jgi:hypothetical protein
MAGAMAARLVMPGLVPGIHVLTPMPNQDVDGRDKPGHDDQPTIGTGAVMSSPSFATVQRYAIASTPAARALSKAAP